MRKPNQTKINEAIRDCKNGASINNLPKLGYTKAQVKDVEEIINKKCQEDIQLDSDIRSWVESL